MAALLSGCINDANAPEAEAKAEQMLRKGDTPVARVGTTLLYQSDVLRAAKAQKHIKDNETLAMDDPRFTEILDELVDQRLLKLDAISRGLESNPEIRRRVFEARERILASYLVEAHLKETVTEDNLRELYRSQALIRQNSEEAEVRLIRVVTEAEAKSVAEKLAAGEDFADMAAEFSIDEATGDNGGSLGFVSRVMLSEEMADVVFLTKAGARSKPFYTEDGWVIVQVDSFRKPPQASFDSMRPQLRQYKTYAEIQDLMVNLRQSGDVEILTTTPALRGQANPTPDAATQETDEQEADDDE